MHQMGSISSRNNHKYWVALFTLLLFVSGNSHDASAQFIRNMSFESATGQGVAPDGWSTCTEFSTPDTQPGAWEVTTAPSDGGSYLGLVTRGNLGPFANQNEDAESNMLEPLIKGKLYSFTVDLAHSKEFGHVVSGDFLAYDTPAKLQVYGGAVKCDQRELLWESPAIDHTEWQTYVMNIVPENVNVFYITLAAEFLGEETYFGNVLVDNITECTIDLTLPSDTVICQRSPFILDAFFEGATYLWQDGSTNSFHTIDTTRLYTVDVSNPCVTRSYDINVVARNCVCDTALPIETVAFDTLICEAVPLGVNITTPGGRYLWDDGTTGGIRTIDKPGAYQVEVTNGCESEFFEFNVETQSCDCEVQVPNVFTPNGDGVNEAFEVQGTPGILSYELQVFNRLGKKIFTSNDLKNQWTGDDAAPGMYYWAANLGCIQGSNTTNRSYNGTVTVLR